AEIWGGEEEEGEPYAAYGGRASRRANDGDGPLSSPGELRAAHRLEIAPLADPQFFRPLEAVHDGQVGGGIGKIRLHRPDRQPQLLADGLEPLVVPSVRGHRPLPQGDLD